jgi:hypothetical protein
MEKGGRAPSDEVAKASSEAGDVPSSLACPTASKRKAPGADHSDEVAKDPDKAGVRIISRYKYGTPTTCMICEQSPMHKGPFCQRCQKACRAIAYEVVDQNCLPWWRDCKNDRHKLCSAVNVYYKIRDEKRRS